MADVAIKQAQVAPAPAGYTIPGAQEIVIKSVKATFDGTGAAGAFVPTLQIVEPGGTVMVECVLGSSVAAGASVDMSWFPGVDNAAAVSSGSGFQFNSGTYGADNVGDWSLIEATGTIGQLFSKPNSGANDETSYSIGVNAAKGVDFVSNPTTGQPVINIEAGGIGNGGTCLVANTTDIGGGAIAVTGANITTQAKSTLNTEALSTFATMNAGATGNAIGLNSGATSNGTGKEIAADFSTGGVQTGANSLALQCTNAAGTPIFQVRNDGTVHILTGGVIHADL